VDEQRVDVAAPSSPELLSELSRLQLENSQLRAMLDHLATGDKEFREPSSPRLRWWAGRTIAALLFATGIALATLMVVEGPSGRQLRGAVRAVWRQGLRDGLRDGRDRIRSGRIIVRVPPIPSIPPMPPIPPMPARP
jgi:hypothetical protein